jgi:predicted translin family RNA/ssDNA-binding protein
MPDYNRIAKELEDKDNKREEVIAKTRVVLKDAKKIISLVHKGDFKGAKKEHESCSKSIKEAYKSLEPENKYIFNDALAEYAEAVCFLKYVETGKIPSHDDIQVELEPYLLGLCDLTGELARRAVYQVSAGEYKDVVKIGQAVSEVYDGFLNFSLRNGELRKKFDSIKWNLKKIEEIVLELKIRDKI